MRNVVWLSSLVLAVVIGRLSVRPTVVNVYPEVQCVEAIQNVQTFDGEQYRFTPRARVRFTNGELHWPCVSGEIARRHARGEKLETRFPYLTSLVDADQ